MNDRELQEYLDWHRKYEAYLDDWQMTDPPPTPRATIEDRNPEELSALEVIALWESHKAKDELAEFDRLMSKLPKSRKTVKRSQKSTMPVVKLTADELLARLSGKVIGQEESLRPICDYVEMFQTGLCDPDRPAAAFLMLGPTGVGKTRSIEALAEVLHGSKSNLIRIDCGEYQGDHEVAKLIGAPPGYLGHRETTARLTQSRLNQASSDQCGLSLVLFDEIEKAGDGLAKILLGILDKGTLTLGTNEIVTFGRTMVFFTSNLGAAEILKSLHGRSLGFGGQKETRSIRQIAEKALRRRYSAEFLNRLTDILTYKALDFSDARKIAAVELTTLVQRISRVQPRVLKLIYDSTVADSLAHAGSNPDYGARELVRTLDRRVMKQVSRLVTDGQIASGDFSGVLHLTGGNEVTVRALTIADALAMSLVIDDSEAEMRVAA